MVRVCAGNKFAKGQIFSRTNIERDTKPLTAHPHSCARRRARCQTKRSFFRRLEQGSFEKDCSHPCDNWYNQAVIAHAGFSPVHVSFSGRHRAMGFCKKMLLRRHRCSCHLANQEETLLKDTSFFYTENVVREIVAQERPQPDRLPEEIERKPFFSFIEKGKEVARRWTLE